MYNMEIKKEGKVVYYAHPLSHYDTDFEWECVETILHMLTPIGEDPTEGYIHIMNPNQRWLSNLYKNRTNGTDPFEIFREIVRSCNAIVGVTFFDGTLGSGVAEEMREGLRNGIPVYVIFIDDGKKLFMPVSDIAMPGYRILSRVETRKKINDGEM
jgi:hypothetical protein